MSVYPGALQSWGLISLAAACCTNAHGLCSAGNVACHHLGVDNRAGIEGTLHSIIAIRERGPAPAGHQDVVGLTYRIGTHVPGKCLWPTIHLAITTILSLLLYTTTTILLLISYYYYTPSWYAYYTTTTIHHYYYTTTTILLLYYYYTTTILLLL